MDIHEAMREARKGDAYNRATFILVGTNGSTLACRMLDAHFDMFTVDGHKGFLMSNQVPDGFKVFCYDPKGGEENG